MYFFSRKKNIFSEKNFFPKNISFYLFSMQLFSADATIFSKNKKIKSLTPK